MRLRKLFFLFFAIVAGAWLLRKCNMLPDFGEIFSSKAVIIDETPILIKEIKSIAQLVTITSFDEVVVDSTIPTRSSALVHSFNSIAPLPIIPVVEKTLVLIVKGKVLAGTDLQQLIEGDIQIMNDTVRVRLPKAIILDAIINPSDFETFDEKGTWSDEDVRSIKIRARDKMIERALQQNILAKADARAKEIIKGFILSAGYKNVIVDTR